MTGQQLKNSILQLAIQGKLVPQDPNDEPASKLLARIRKEKEQLVKDGKLKKKDLVTTPITDEEKPFDIPESWEWCRLGELASYVVDCPHSTPQKVNYVTQYPCIRTSEIKNGKIQWESMQYLDEANYNIRIKRLKPQEGDIVYAREGAYGDAVILPDTHNFCLGQRTMMLRLTMRSCVEYVHQAIISPFGYAQAVALNREGTTSVGHVNMSDIVNFLIPLPPLSEQHRIIEKIEELMPLVEQYGKSQEKLEALNESLPEALKKSILQEAIMGRLVPQDPVEEPASALLARIRKEKEQLVKDGKLKKKDLVTTPITDEEKPFDIPESWEWCRVGHIFQTYSGGTPDKGHPEYYSSKDIMWAKVADLGPLYLSETEDYISNIGLDNSSAKLYPENTVLVAMYCNDAIGKSTVTKSVMASNQAICGILPNKYILPEFLYYAIQHSRPALIEKSAGGAQKNINQKIVNDIIFPLPPLSEQHRIVKKIEELFDVLK